MRPATSTRRELTIDDANLLERFFAETPAMQQVIRESVEMARYGDADESAAALATLTEALYPTSEDELQRQCEEVFGRGTEAQ